MTDQASTAKNQRKLVGRVTSNKMQKTVVVRVERRVREAMMGKTITRSRKTSWSAWRRTAPILR